MLNQAICMRSGHLGLSHLLEDVKTLKVSVVNLFINCNGHTDFRCVIYSVRSFAFAIRELVFDVIQSHT